MITNDKFYALVSELFQLLNTVEVSENGSEFHPTTINSCRVAHIMRLNDLLPEIEAILGNNKDKVQ